MAYGVKWFSEFKNIDGDLSRVEVLERDYSGVASEVTSSGNPVVISFASDLSSNLFEPIRATKGEFEWMAEEGVNFDIENLFITDDRKYKVSLTIEGSLKWIGYIVFSNCEAPYLSKPYPVKFSAVCGLVLLSKERVLNTGGTFFLNELGVSYHTILGRALNNIGHEIPLSIYAQINEPNKEALFDKDAFGPTFINVGNERLDDINYLELLELHLNAFNCYITQKEGKWIIQDVRGLTQDNYKSINFPFPSYSSLTHTITTENKVITLIEDKNADKDSVYLSPTSDVIESLSNPKSKVSVTVDAGNPVNRLKNGRFAPASVVGTQTWHYTLGGTGGPPWIQGNNTPEDPYRVQISKFDKSDGMLSIVPIVLNIGDLDVEKPEEYNIRLNVSGYARMCLTPAIGAFISVNFGERIYASQLLSGGKWDLTRKGVRDSVPISAPLIKERKVFSELPDTFFSVTTDPITNWLDRPDGWQAHILIGFYIEGKKAEDTHPDVYLHDFRISVDTGTVYEGSHTYEIDGSNIIINGEEYTYNIGIADKININSPEQDKVTNRVLGGYSKIALSLTNSWTRIIDGTTDPYNPVGQPIQYLSIKERIRQMCGKRRELSGTFNGKGIWADSSIRNHIEDEWKPMAISNWEWNVKNNRYDLSMVELNFAPILNEEIMLVEEDANGNKRRVSASTGSGTSSSGGSSSNLNPIVVADFETITGVIGKPLGELSFDIKDYIESIFNEESIFLRLIAEPSWVTVNIDEQEFTISGTPDQAGKSQVLIEVSDGSGDEYIVSIPILIYDKTTSTITIEGVDNISDTPSVFPYEPNYSVFTTVKGNHDAYRVLFTSSQSGFSYDSGIVDVATTNIGSYQIIEDEVLSEGTIVATVITYKIKPKLEETDADEYVEVYRNRGVAILGEDLGQNDPNKIAKISLTKDDVVVTELSPSEAIVDYIDKFNVHVETIGIKFDTATLSITPEIDPFYATFSASQEPVLFTTTNVVLNPLTGATTPSSTYITTDNIPTSVGDIFWVNGEDLIVVGYNGVTFKEELIPYENGEIHVGEDITSIRVSSTSTGLTIDHADIPSMDLFAMDEPKGSGKYSAFFKAYLAGNLVYETFVRWDILDEIPEPIAPTSGVKVIKKDASNTLIKEVSLIGDIIPLPSVGWGAIVEFVDIDIDKITWTLFQLQNDAWVEVSIPTFTGFPNEKDYSNVSIPKTISIFGNKSSKDIGSIHGINTRFKLEAKGYLDGEVVIVKQGDWMFKEDLPVGEPSGMDFKLYREEPHGWDMVDENMPSTGGVYPTYRPRLINIFAYGVDGTSLFNSVKIKKSKNGVPLGWVVNGDTIVVTNFSPPVSSATGLYTFGTVIDGRVYLKNASGVNVLIDDAGDYVDSFEFYLDDALVGIKSVSYKLVEYDPNPEPQDPNECCDIVYDEFEF